MEEKDMKLDFTFIDEFGQESRLVKTFNPCVLQDTDTFDLLVDEFRNFLRASGFSDTTVNTIQIVEEEK